jgi:glycosyltransferase involved in cell wall biosynthesis
VVTACRDDGDFLAEAVASVDDIADGSVELTIVDDGSTDPETIRVLAELERTGRHVIRTEAIGLSAARNTACSTSQTKAVIALDSDNRLRPAVLIALTELHEHDLDIVHGSWHRFGVDDQTVIPPQMTLESLIPYNSIDACAVVSRDMLTRLGGWDENLPYWEDWDMWLGAVRAGARTKASEDIHFDYLVRPESLNHRATADADGREIVYRFVIEKHKSLLSPEVRKLVEWVHRLDVVNLRLERAYYEILVHQPTEYVEAKQTRRSTFAAFMSHPTLFKRRD